MSWARALLFVKTFGTQQGPGINPRAFFGWRALPVVVSLADRESTLPSTFLVNRISMQMRIRLWLVLSLLVSGTTWLYMHRVLEPWEYYVKVETGLLKAQFDDLYSPWMGTRALLLHGMNPYGPEVSHEIQMEFYGRIIEQKYDDPFKIIDEQRFAYPVYVVLLMAPAAYVDLAQLRAWSPVILASLTALSVLLWLEVLRWRPPRMIVVSLILFVLSSPQAAQGLLLRQLGLLVGCLLALATWCVSRRHLATAGIALAVATIKPQIVVLPLVWFLLWAAGNWGKRWRLIAGFAVAMAALVGAGEWILPGWIGYFIAGIAAYRRYGLGVSLLRLALGDWIGGAITGVLVAGVLIFGWKNRKHAEDSPQFGLALAVFCMGAALALPLLTPFNQVLLILPAAMILRDWAALPNVLRIAFVTIVSWPCVTALALLFFPPDLHSPNRLPLLPSLLVLWFPFILPLLVRATQRGSAQLTSPTC